MKNNISIKSLLLIIVIGISQLSVAVTHGSLAKRNQNLYEVVADNADLDKPRADIKVDFGIVTINGKTWAGTQLTNAEFPVTQNWASQFRFYDASNAKTETNLLYRSNSVTFGSTTNTIPQPCTVAFFQYLDGFGGGPGFSMTEKLTYDPTILNSLDPLDVTPPVLNSVNIDNVKNNNVTLSFSTIEESEMYFYYIRDVANNYEEVTFIDNPILWGLTPSTSYNLTITPIDFSGNEGNAVSTAFTTLPIDEIYDGSTPTQSENTLYPYNPELIATISLSDNTITMGCTTASPEIAYTWGWNNRVFYNPYVEIDKVDYPLTLDVNGNSATTTFTGSIGSKSIAPGTTFKIRWHTYWDATQSLHYYTGEYNYSIPTTTNIENQLEDKTIKFYPNPVKDYLYFNKEVKKCSVYDMTGKLLLNQSNVKELNIKELQDGVYILRIENSDKVITNTQLIKN